MLSTTTATTTATINKIDAAVTVTGYNVPYDGTQHTASATATGLNGASVGSFTLTGTQHTNAGTYTADAWSFSGGTNYNDKSGTVSDSIAKATPSVTVSFTPSTVMYDANSHAAAAAVTGVGGVNLSGHGALSVTYTPGANVVPVNAGNYLASAHFTSSDTNYSDGDSATQASLVVNKATLTVTADNKSMVLHGTVPALTFQISGFKGTDTASVLTTQPTCTTTGTPTSNVGSYPITCSGGTATNYSFTYAAGNLTILYATGTVCSNGIVGHQIQQPINVDGSSVFKFGSTVPTKFTVCDAGGTPISTTVVASFTVAGYVGGTVSNVNEDIVSTTPDTAFRWDPTARQWIFNLSTSGLSKNATAVFIIKLNDGTIVGPVVGGANVASGASSFQFGLK
jgi:hypothetical protein